jgi:nucleoside-diphosphate-sugar epimerase
MKCLVTGGAGFIGSHLVTKLLNLGHDVTVVDALLESTYSAEIKQERFMHLANLHNPRLKLIQKDIRFEPIIEEIESCDVIFNLAAMPGLALSWKEFDLYLGCNVTLVERIIQAIQLVGGRRLIHISTSSVYGRFATGDENTPLEPFSPYGVTKASAEMLLRGYKDNFDLDVTVLRYFSVYGPGQRPDMAYAKFIKAIIDGAAISIFGDGGQMRTNTFVSDCVDGTIAALSTGKSGEIYNIAGIEEYSVLESISIIEEILKKKANVQFVGKVPGDQQITRGVITKAQRDFGFAPTTTLKSGLEKQVSAFLNRSYF